MSWKDNLHYVGLAILLGGVTVVAYLGFEQVLRVLDLIRSVPV